MTSTNTCTSTRGSEHKLLPSARQSILVAVEVALILKNCICIARPVGTHFTTTAGTPIFSGRVCADLQFCQLRCRGSSRENWSNFQRHVTRANCSNRKATTWAKSLLYLWPTAILPVHREGVELAELRRIGANGSIWIYHHLLCACFVNPNMRSVIITTLASQVPPTQGQPQRFATRLGFLEGHKLASVLTWPYPNEFTIGAVVAVANSPLPTMEFAIFMVAPVRVLDAPASAERLSRKSAFRTLSSPNTERRPTTRKHKSFLVKMRRAWLHFSVYISGHAR